MSLLSNPNPVRLGLYQSWLSNWYENNTIYSSLLYSDIYINEFLNGIFYKLKMPSSIPIIRDLGYNQTLISIKSLLYLKKTRRNKFRKAFLLKKTIKVKHRKILLFLKRTINKFKKKNNVSYTKLSFLPIFIFYKKIKNKKVKNINVKKKWNYLYYKINDRYYHFKKIKKKLFKKTKKFKLTTLNKKYNLVKKIKKNINRQKKYKKKNDKKEKKDKYILINIEKKKRYNTITTINKINIKKNKNKRNNKILKKKIKKSYLIFKKKKYNTFLYNYKKKINFNKKVNKINKKRLGIYFKKNKIDNNIYNRNENKKYIYNNILILIFQWFTNKIMNWLIFVFMQIITIFTIFNKNNIIKKKNVELIFKLKKTIIEKIKIIIMYIINTIKKKMIFKYKKKINIIKKNIFVNKNINMYLIKKKHLYSRIKSYYRLKKKIIRDKKKKEYELKYSPRIFNIHFRLLSLTKKWLQLYYYSLNVKQLNLKVNNTLNIYLQKPIFFINKCNRYKFNRLDNPKLLSDYIKITMKYEFKNPSILRKVVEYHSKQNKNCRKYSYILRKKLITIKKKIKNKLYLFYKKNYKKIYYITEKHSNLSINKKDDQLNIYKNNYNFKKKIIKKNNKKKISISVTLNKSKRELYYKKKLNNKQKNNNINISNIIIKNKIKKSNNINVLKKKNNIYSINKSIILLETLNNWRFKFRDFSYKRYPLIGLRIELNGPVKKGRRTKKHIYNEWVDFYRLPGKMPLVTIMSDIHYWQTYGLTARASIGIKLWMYFFSPFYTETSKKLINTELNDYY